MTNKFGDPSIYYAQYDYIDQPYDDKFITQLLLPDHKNVKSIVEKTCKRWNQIIREYLRTETGLRFSFDESQRTPILDSDIGRENREVTRHQQNIPVRIKDGLPPPLWDILPKLPSNVTTVPNHIFWKLYKKRSELEKAVTSLRFVLDNYKEIKDSIETNDTPEKYIEQTSIFISELLINHIRNYGNDIIEGFKKINHDVLGAYFFRIPEINIYWMALGIISSGRNIDLEGLTVVVLTHELAHAYSHRGYDIDGNLWGTEAFAESDLKIVEGLAQQYTRVICENKLLERYPQAKAAYEKLLKIQEGPYTVHMDWMKNDYRSGEIIRYTMINARLREIREYDKFLKLMEETEGVITRGNM